MTKIKLCGLRSKQDIEVANELQVDYVGFVFAKGSKRFVTEKTVRELRKYLDSSIQAVGVFVNDSPEKIAFLLNANVIQIAQLHGSESASDLADLRKLTDKPIIMAYQIAGENDFLDAQLSEADYVLFDSGSGSGEVFDWSLLSYFKRPVFLAGGLTCENVADAIQKVHPYAVDVSSGIETEGHKDPQKMREFVGIVRSLQKEVAL